MATPIPVSKPTSSGVGGIVAMLLVLLLVGAEYYLLTTQNTLRLHPVSVGISTRAGTKDSAQQRQAIPPVKSAKAKPKLKISHQLRKDSKSKTPKPGAAAANGPKPIDLSNVFGGTPGGPSYQEQAVKKALELENEHVGLGIRAVLILACVSLLFMQKPPAPKVGAARRYARKQQDILIPFQVCTVLLTFSGLALLGVGTAVGNVLVYGYPAAAVICLASGFVGGFLRASTLPVEGRLMAEKVRSTEEYAIVLKAEGNKYVNFPNPFRGTLVLGGAGAGKTFSIGEPFLEQFLNWGMCGIIYDFKFPVLAGAAQKGLLYAQPAHEKLLKKYQDNLKNNVRNKDGLIEGLRKPIRHRVINFVDMTRTEKVNPLRAQDMPTTAYAMEYAQTILTNLSPGGAKGNDNFFTKSAQAYLTGIIWYYRNNFPALCTIPHVVATALYKEYTFVLHMLRQDPQCQVLVQSLITAVETGAEKQIAGVVSSLQVDMSGLATPEISWVLAPDENPLLGEEAEGFSLNLNDPNNPTILTIGNDPTLSRTFSPVISCVIAVALKLMNQQRKHPSFVVIDEGATIYVPGLEVIPATARSNKVAMLYMTQDMAQLIDAYGKDKAQVLVSNLNNQCFGKINSGETAKLISEMIGREDVEMVSINSGQSMGATGSSSKGQSVSVQERQVFRTQDAYTLRQGEFVGQTVERPQSFFMGMIERDLEIGSYPIEPFSFFAPERGVVSGRIREKLAEEEKLVKSNLSALATARLREESARAQLRKKEMVQARTEVKRPTEFAKGKRLALVTPPDSLAPGNAENQENIRNTENQENIRNIKNPAESGGTTAADWDWDEVTSGPAKWQPSPAERERLRLLAAQTQHARERTTLTPEAASQPAPAPEEESLAPELSLEEQEAIRARLAEERAKERLRKLEADKGGSVLKQLVDANHEHIAREVEHVILKSGPNSLSKAGLNAAAAKEKAEAMTAEKGEKLSGEPAEKLDF